MLRLLNENDKTEIMGKISEVDSKIAGGQIVIEKSGTVVTASDSAEAGFAGLSVFGKSTQDGTPTPTAPIEIVSVENLLINIQGKNLLPYPYVDGTSKEMNGITYTVREDGSILVNGTATELSFFTFNYGGNKKPLPIGNLVTDTGTGYGSDTVQIQNDIYINGEYSMSLQTVTKSSAKRSFSDKVELGASRIKVDAGVTINNVVVYPLLYASEEVTLYEQSKSCQTLSVPHTLRGIPVTSGGNYTDENGQQWICDEVDFDRGVLVQRVANKVFDGSSDEIWYDELVLDTTVMFRIQISDSANVGNVVGKDFICTHFEVKNMYNSDITGTQHTMQQFYFRLSKTALSTADMNGFKELLSSSPMTVSYALKTPIEIALTEEEIEAYKALYTNKPSTTVFNDSGTGMAVDYVADAKLYIDNKFEEIKAMITAE